MTTRLNYMAAAPKAIALLFEQEKNLQQQFSESDSLTIAIWELVKLRVSQINHCAFCIDMHCKDALKQGETIERIYGLTAWRDMPFYSDNERAALAWAELITEGKPISDSDYQQGLSIFGDASLVNLTIAVNAINSWNRIAKTFKPEVGSYKAG